MVVLRLRRQRKDKRAERQDTRSREGRVIHRPRVSRELVRTPMPELYSAG